MFNFIKKHKRKNKLNGKQKFTPFFLKTPATIFVTAIEVKFVVGAPFHKIKLPHTKAIAIFQPYTAAGKLNAVMIPTIPKGFQRSIMK